MPGLCAAATNCRDDRAQPARRGPSGTDARGGASGVAEGVAPDAQRRGRSAQNRGGLGADRVVAVQRRELRAGVEGDGWKQDEARHTRAARAARIDSPASVGRARILADHSERSIPTCSTSGTQPRTGSSIHTRSSRDRSGVCGGSARTAGGIGRRRRCRAVIACSGAAQRARSGWRAESSLSARTSAAL